MVNTAKILRISDIIEEEITVDINDIEVTLFGANVPYNIQVNKVYPIEIELFADEIIIQENSDCNKQVIRNSDSFSYTLMGRLNEQGQFDVGFLIEDDCLKTYEYLYGEYVTLNVLRLNASFLL